MITVMLAACSGETTTSSGCTTDADCSGTQKCVSGRCRSSSTSSSSRASGTVQISINAPESIFAEAGTEDEFSLSIEADDQDLRQPVLILSNFGPYLSSPNCEGSVTLNTIDAGDSEEIECTVRIKDAPSQNRDQEVEYELEWTGDLNANVDGVEIMTDEKFDLESPSQSDASASMQAGPVEMTLTIEDVPAKTGDRINAKVSIEASSTPNRGVKCIESEGSCSHHVDELSIKIPSGFQVVGLSGYASTRCGEGYTCFVKDKVKLSDGQYEEEFSLTLPDFASGITRQTFLFEAFVNGVRFYEVDSFELSLEAPEE